MYKGKYANAFSPRNHGNNLDKSTERSKRSPDFNGSATSLSYEPRIRRLRHWGVKGWKLHFQDPIGAIFFIDVCVNI